MHGFEQLIRQQEERRAREAGDGRYDAQTEPHARLVQQEYGVDQRTARAVARVLSRMEGWLWTDVREELLVALTFVEGQCPSNVVEHGAVADADTPCEAAVERAMGAEKL